jgi:ABC-type bacteriocin/lantibiotic exporter with double-glycine peptidase domain
MLNGKKFTEQDEKELALDGSERTYPFYVVGIPMEFVKKFNCRITIYADNKFFASVLQKSFMQEKRVSVVHKKITDAFIGELLKTQPIICHIDDHILGDYSHASHFIILEKTTKKFIYIIDPWSGKKKRIINTKLEKAISDLKNQVKMCPLLFSIEA